MLAPTIALGLVPAAGAGLAWAVRGRSATLLAPSVWRGPRDSRAVALTFDDGPSESTPQLLEVLARHRAQATFFACGANVDRLPQVASEVVAAGHELGSHGYAHRLYSLRPARFIRDDVARAQNAIERATGRVPSLFRPPFGVRWFGLGAAQREHRLLGVMWSVIGCDWKLASADVVKRVTSRVAGGAIICLHDGRELQARPDISVTLAAVGPLLDRLANEGYEFKTVSQLIKQRRAAAPQCGE